MSLRIAPLINPSDAHLKAIKHKTSHTYLILGYIYCLTSVIAGWYFVFLVFQSFSNDLWWANYSLSDYQAYLIDCVNGNLQYFNNAPLNITSGQIHKMYMNGKQSSTAVPPTYVRHLILNELVSISHAIQSLRAMDPALALIVKTQFCYVDFEQRWQMAHTAKRQLRCQSYRNNGAVFLVSILRNIDYDLFMEIFGGPGNVFTIGIESGLIESMAGRELLKDIAQVQTTVHEEEILWRSFNITNFQLQWHNRYQSGLLETFDIINSLGWKQTITLKNIASVRGVWTSAIAYYQLINDLYYMQPCNESLIRNNVSNSFATGTCLPSIEDVAYLTDGNGVYSAQRLLVHENIGPFLSIDTFYIPVPQALKSLVANAEVDVIHVLRSNSSYYDTYNSINVPALSPIPPSWSTHYTFHGGSPFCLYDTAKPFLQAPFDFSTACEKELSFVISWTPLSLVLALHMANTTIEKACSLQAEADCLTWLRKTLPIVEELPRNLTINVSHLPFVGIIQYGRFINDSTWHFLFQPLLTSDAWSFYGWSMLIDWAMGVREVVTVEGDEGSFKLISNLYPMDEYSTSGGNLHMPNSTNLMAYFVLYSSIVLTALVVLGAVLIILQPAKVYPINLIAFPRIAGSVWIGRPLLFVRGCTALAILGSCNIVLTQARNWTWFVTKPRGILDIAILASEATWVVYNIQDVFQLIIPTMTPVYAPFAVVLAWSLQFALEYLQPVQPSGHLKRDCQTTNLDASVSCASGELAVGDFQRVVLLVGFQILSVGVAILGAIFFRSGEAHQTEQSANNKFYILSGIPSVFLKSEKDIDAIPNDPFACLIAGLIPIRTVHKAWLFDLNRWIVVKLCRDAAKSLGNFMPLHSHILCITHIPANTLSMTPNHQVHVETLRKPWTWWGRILFALPAIASIIYMVVSMESSSYYLKVSSLSLSNDLVWANFTMQTTHLFIAIWLNQEFPLMQNDDNSTKQLVLDAPEVNMLDEALASPTIILPGNRGIHVQNYHLQNVEASITGLRNTPASSLPWIMTPYCFVDFNQTWMLANSRKRQHRCTNYTQNGAVYLESVLRNTVWSDWVECCGNAFTIGIATELSKSNLGYSWLNQTISAASAWVAVSQEVNYWESFGITSFQLQWQNYKAIGVINTYSVRNAYERSYSFTLEALNGSYRFASQTSFKMYWSLANDFAQLTMNGSGITGKSLISTSSNYAFLNHSLQTTMITNCTIVAPFNFGFDAVENAIGPFGSIDLHFIPVPESVQSVVHSILTALHTALSINHTYSAIYKNISISVDVWPVPMPWIEANFYTYGGSPLCDSIYNDAAVGVAAGLLSLFSFDLGCDRTSYYSHLHFNRETLVIASALTKLNQTSNFTEICNHDPLDFTVCLEFLSETIAFTSLWIDYIALSPAIREAQQTLEQLNIKLIQYATPAIATPIALQSLPLFNSNDTTFDLYAWAMIYEWATNNRDVVHFVGDNGSFVLISERTSPITQGVYPSELSSTLTSYARSSNIFVTSIMMCVAFVVTVYIAVAHCMIERKNIFKLNRVGAFSWVGRPLVLVRSITAMCLLSTAQLNVVSVDGLSMLQSSPEVWYNIILAAGEVTWLVEVVNDLAMVITREYTAYYATANSLLVWCITALLSFFIPVKYSAERNISCHLAQVDYQIVCHTATIVIGHWDRMALLILITVGCNAICYIFTRVWIKHNWESLPDRLYRCFTGSQVSKPIQNVSVRSLLLSGGATYLFSHGKWVHGDIYFLDRASAVINGILTVRRNKYFYVLDIKLWRIFVVEAITLPPEHPLAEASRYALPLYLH